MIKNYLKIAVRSLWKGRIFNGMNVLGLSIAIACCTLLFLAVYYEFSFDKFHTNLPNIYQLYRTEYRAQKIEKSTSLPIPLRPALKAEYSDLAYITREGSGGAMVTYKDKQLGQSIRFVDQDFLKIFTFPISKGNATNPLNNLNEVAITEYSAKAIFGSEDAVGKVIELNYGDKPQSFMVSAVLKDFPNNSSLQFDILMRFENFPGYKAGLNEWNNENHSVYLQLKDKVDPETFTQRVQAFTNRHFDEQVKTIKRDGAHADAHGNIVTLSLTPFSENHFNTELGGLEGTSVSKSSVIGLMVIGIFILLIACINFINLSVARSFTRAREVGVRKTLGATRWQLLTQFWIETVLLCVVALVIGLALASIFLSGFKANLKSDISMSMLLHPLQLLAAVGIFVFVTVVAGFYPATLMQRYKTVEVLKGTASAVKPGKIRNTLLVVQFTISSLLIVCTLVTWQQINFMQNKPLGYNKTEVLSIPVGSGTDGVQALNLFRNVLQGQPNVVSITGAYDNLGRGNDGSQRTSVSGFNYKGHEVRSNIQRVDFDYLKTLDIKLVDGRDFSKEFATDSNAVLINENMARQIAGNKSAVGAYLPINDDKNPSQVIGVIKNYNFRSLHEDIAPLTLTMFKAYGINYIFVKVKPGSLVASFNQISRKWHETFPTVDFKGSWLSENTEKQYRKEKRLSTIFVSSAIIAIVISCIGLIAISIMIMVQRTKEIGIRKVLGSSVSGIVLLLSRDFIKLVLLASVLSFPIAWWLMSKWLESYVYRITIHWWIFAVSAAITVIIAFVTISFQSIKAALTNPVKSLRSE